MMSIENVFDNDVNKLDDISKSKLFVRWLKDSGYYAHVRKIMYNAFHNIFKEGINNDIIDILCLCIKKLQYDNIIHPDYYILHSRYDRALFCLLNVKWKLFLINNTKDGKLPSSSYNKSHHKTTLKIIDYELCGVAQNFHLNDLPYELVLELLLEAPKTFIRNNVNFRFDKLYNI